jgi:NAD(P)-dependent dehydrogenase (short-subunit alcohol dehydrogenase family)
MWGAPTTEHGLEGWNKVITLNVTAIFVVTQEVGRRCMVPRRRGKVINIASIQGLTGSCPVGLPTLAYNTSIRPVLLFTADGVHVGWLIAGELTGLLRTVRARRQGNSI